MLTLGSVLVIQVSYHRCPSRVLQSYVLSFSYAGMRTMASAAK